MKTVSVFCSTFRCNRWLGIENHSAELLCLAHSHSLYYDLFELSLESSFTCFYWRFYAFKIGSTSKSDSNRCYLFYAFDFYAVELLQSAARMEYNNNRKEPAFHTTKLSIKSSNGYVLCALHLNLIYVWHIYFHWHQIHCIHCIFYLLPALYDSLIIQSDTHIPLFIRLIERNWLSESIKHYTTHIMITFLRLFCVHKNKEERHQLYLSKHESIWIR